LLIQPERMVLTITLANIYKSNNYTSKQSCELVNTSQQCYYKICQRLNKPYITQQVNKNKSQLIGGYISDDEDGIFNFEKQNN